MHKDPPLELVGWWSTAPSSGPEASHLPLHRQLIEKYNESAVFLAFHPSQLQASEAHNSKLPLTIYESVLEDEGTNDASKDMEIDGQEAVSLRFRELRYSVETGEAEMIGVNTIVQSSGTAAAAETHPVPAANDTKLQSTKSSTEKSKEEEPVATKLTQEEEESKCCTAPSPHPLDPYTVIPITHLTILSLASDRKPQHPPQRSPHPRIPHWLNKILRL